MTHVQRRGRDVASRAAQLQGEGAFAVLAAARRLEARGHSVIHLEIGEMDAETPPHVVEAGLRALRGGDRRYAPPAGIPELREAIAASLAGRGVRAGAEQIVVTGGGKPALFTALCALIELGDEVLIPDPGFPSFEQTVRFANGVPVRYGLDAARGFALDVERIATHVGPRSRVLVLNAPHNPTGGAPPTDAVLADLARLAERHDLWIVADEVYGRLTFDGEPRSIASLAPERTLIVDSFSKSYAMSGWRLGYVAAPRAVAETLARLVVHHASCTAPFVQRAGVAALTGPDDFLIATRRRLRQRADELVEGLTKIPGIACHRPAATLFAFPDIRGVLTSGPESTESFAQRLLARHGVAALPGTAFGPGGAGHLRLAFATTPDAVREALARLARCAAERPGAPSLLEVS